MSVPQPFHPEDRSARWHGRRDEIVDAAARLFAEHGYHATGTAELCRATGMGKGSLYYHVESKENLLFLIHERVMREVVETARAIASSPQTASERLNLLAAEQLRIITSWPDHVWVFMHEFRYLEGDRARQFKKARQEYESIVEKILEDGTESGEFEIADIRIATLAWLGMYNYTYVWLQLKGRLRSEEIVAQFQNVFLRGVLSKRNR